MNLDSLQVCTVDHRLEITLNRPKKRNALTPDMLRSLATALSDPGDAEYEVLRSGMEAGFSAGFDLDALRELGPAAHDGDPIGAAVEALIDCRVPTVAVLNGYCIGASVELIAACDLRVARSDLRITVPANRLGAPYRPSGVDLLARRFGWATAVELLVFGTTFGSAQALARQLVSFVGSADEVEEKITELGQNMNESPAVAAAHRSMLAQWSKLPPSDDKFLEHWEQVRSDAVTTRRIPPTTEPDQRSVSHV